jgi:signal transduction histidine kinase
MNSKKIIPFLLLAEFLIALTLLSVTSSNTVTGFRFVSLFALFIINLLLFLQVISTPTWNPLTWFFFATTTLVNVYFVLGTVLGLADALFDFVIVVALLVSLIGSLEIEQLHKPRMPKKQELEVVPTTEDIQYKDFHEVFTTEVPEVSLVSYEKPNKNTARIARKPAKRKPKTKPKKQSKKKSARLVASKTGKNAHLPKCMVAARIPPRLKVTLTSASDAKKRGYQACKACKPF